MATKRLQKELTTLNTTPVKYVTVIPNEQNMFQWDAIIQGPPNTPFNGGVFKLKIEAPDNYPFVAPKVKFHTKIYHPNVDEQGAICLDILKSDNWKPAVTMSHVLQAIVDLLVTPHPDDPLREDVASLFKTNPAQYEATAKAETQKYAH